MPFSNPDYAVQHMCVACKGNSVSDASGISARLMHVECMTHMHLTTHTAGCMHLRYSETVPPSAPMRGGAVAVARLRSGVMPGPASFISFVLFYGCR